MARVVDSTWGDARRTPMTNYMWVHTTGVPSVTVGDLWYPSFRVPTTTFWEHRREDISPPKWLGPDTLTVTVDKTIVTPPDSDFIAPDFEERFKDEVMQMVQEYINGMMPLLIDVIRNAPSMFGVEKKLTEGVFCFNCGAPIIRGLEQEPCPYCGR